MHFINCAVFLLVFTATTASAQFHTITKDSPVEAPLKIRRIQVADSLVVKTTDHVAPPTDVINRGKFQSVLDRNRYKSEDSPKVNPDLPALNVENLRREIRKNGIKYEDIVVAQALLETGYFKSRVCRELNNLFGLTNPVTGEYYEFQHWSDSVTAYYTKVQHRYKSGNYLLWLRDIGYAEDPGYIRAIIKMLKNVKNMKY